jgi:hypothetical protein
LKGILQLLVIFDSLYTFLIQVINVISSLLAQNVKENIKMSNF